MSTIVSIHSFRGGTGKSNLTANLASMLAQQGKRVAMIDTDIQSPGIHVLFGLDQQTMGHTLNDYLYGRCTIEQVAHDVTSMLTQLSVASGVLFLLPSSINARDIARVLREGYEVTLLQDGLYELSKALTLDYLLIDTHPGLNEETLLSIGLSDVLVVLLRPDKQDFQGTAVTLEVARKLGVPQLLLVINKVLSSPNEESLKQQIQRTYNASVASVLPLSEDMVRMGSDGLFSQKNPDHPYSRGVREVAERLLHLEGGDAGEKPGVMK